jgi:type II secretory pathway component PulL
MMKKGFIDWTSQGVNLFLFERQGGEYVCSETVTVSERGDPDAEELEAISSGGITEPSLSLPVEELTLREIEFPFSDREKIRDTLKYELEGSLLGSVSDYLVDHRIIESSDGKTRVLAVCLEKKRMKEILDLFSSAGIEPRIVTSLDIAMKDAGEDIISGDIVTDTSARAEAAAGELDSPTIDLRQEELAYTGDIDRIKKGLRLTSILVLALVVAVAGHFYLNYYSARKSGDSLSHRLRMTYRSVFPEDRKITDPGRQFLSKLRAAEKKMDALAGIPALDILMKIATAAHEGIVLNELTAEAGSIIIKGKAGSFEQIDNLKNSLAGRFGSVKVLESNASADGKVDFSILMKGAEK